MLTNGRSQGLYRGVGVAAKLIGVLHAKVGEDGIASIVAGIVGRAVEVDRAAAI